MKWLQSLAINRLILLFMLFMAIPAVGLIIHSGLQDRETDRKDAGRASTYLLNNIASELQGKVEATRQLLEVLALLPEVRRHDGAALNQLLADLLREHPMYTNILFVDRSGMTWAGDTPDNKPINLADRKAFRDAMATGSFSSGEFVVGKTYHKIALNFALPLKDHQGLINGAILCGINIAQVGNLSKAGSLPPGTSFGIFDHKGIFLYRTLDPEKFIGKPGKQEAFEQMQNGPDEGTLELVSNDGIRRIAAYRKVRLSNDRPPYAYIRGGTPTETTIKKANDTMIRNLAAMILVLLLVSAVILLLNKRLIADRIAALKTASERIALGDFNVQVAEKVKGGELGVLGKAFDEMSQKLTEYVRERNQAEIELIQREQALADSERFLKAIIDTEPECIKLLDADCNLLMMNPAGLEMIQADSFDQVKGQCVCALITPSYRDAFISLTKQVFMGNAGTLEFETVGLRGGHIWLETHAVPFRNEQGEIISLLGITRDITERKQSEEALRSSEAKFSAIFRTSPDSININRLEDAVFVDVNEGFSTMLGYSREDVLGKPSVEMGVWVDREDRAWLAGQLKEVGFVKNLEARLRRKNGSVLTALVSSRLIELDGVPCTLNIARDITEHNQAIEEKQSLEKQLLNSQKLESLGVLAGGIAHDFNNILTSIVGNADLALMRLNPASPAIDNLHKIEQSAARAADLAKQMLAYSGKGRFVVETVDINTLLTEMLHILEVSITKKAALRLNLPMNLPAIEVDATQIRQVVMNLVINASEAIEENSGAITITAGCTDCDKNYLKEVVQGENVKAGRYVYLEIADTGCGMDKETLAKLFDPFFTTKFTGRGLGMSAVQGIVRGHKGFIHVQSEPGKGSSFKVFLPASDKIIETANNQAQQDDWRGEGKVLLVDDEETVREIGKEMLKEYGFTTITVNDGIEALDAFKATPDFDFVILDLTMPNMDGEQCFYELIKLKPDVKVIMSSGFSEQEVSLKFADKGLAGFIQKPYNMSTLKEAIKNI